MLLKYSKFIFIVVAGFAVLSAYIAKDAQFDYNFDRFFPEGDPEWVSFKNHREQFGSDNDFILIGMRNSGGIFDKEFALQIQRLTDTLRALPFVKKVISPTTLRRRFQTAYLPISVPVWDWKNEDNYSIDSTAIWNSPELYDSWFSGDGESVAILAVTRDFLMKEEADSLAQSLSPILETMKVDEIHATGKALFQAHYLSILVRELPLLMSICGFLIIAFLLVTFRNLHGVIVPLLVISLAVLFTLALMQVAGKPLDVMTVLLPVMIFIVGTSDVVHMYAKYNEELGKGHSNSESIETMIREIGLATFLTSLTTAAGFGTLYFSNIRPVKEFGLFAAAGVMIAFFVTLILLPAILHVFPPARRSSRTYYVKWDQILGRLFIFALRKRKLVFIGTILILITSGIGISKLKVNSLLLEDLAADSPPKMAFSFFEEHFHGVRSFELSLETGDNCDDLLSQKSVALIDKIENYLRSDYLVGGIRSPITGLKADAYSDLMGDTLAFKLPIEKQLDRKLEVWRKIATKKGCPDVLDSSRLHGRIYGRIPDHGSFIVDKKNEKLSRFLAANIDSSVLKVAVTGTGHLMDKNNHTLANGILMGLIVALLLIAILAGFLFRSWKIIPAALIPNITPLLVLAMIIGFSALDLKISTTIIFTIAFGICVDDTVHFMSRYYLELKKGRKDLYALKRTFLSTGKAIILTSIILSAGFATLSASEFTSTENMGILISVCLLFALSADLIVLPGLVLFFRAKAKK